MWKTRADAGAASRARRKVLWSRVARDDKDRRARRSGAVEAPFYGPVAEAPALRAGPRFGNHVENRAADCPSLQIRSDPEASTRTASSRSLDLSRVHPPLDIDGMSMDPSSARSRDPLSSTPARRDQLTRLHLPDSARTVIQTALALIDHIDEQLAPLEAELRSFAQRQPGCLALQGHFGIGELTSVAILAELGDARRFSSSRHAVRFAGLDVTVSQSDESRAPGKPSHQGPPVLRWAAFVAGPVRLARALPQPPLLPRDQGPPGRQAGRADDRPQAASPRPPHPARARRRGAPAGERHLTAMR
jgi:Transposase IS116/IS110/IS902 family